MSTVLLPELNDVQRTQLLALGRRWRDNIQGNRQQVYAIYDAVHRTVDTQGVRAVCAQAYGDDPRQQLDVYLPSDTDRAALRPIVMFVHGGAFVRGHKDATPYLYANVPRVFARAGYIGANLEYRLAPQAPYPAGAEDIASAVGWLRQHAAQWAGDATRIVLIGHSAGGSHVANYLSAPLFQGCTQGVVAAVLISARLDADMLPDNPNAQGVIAYYGADANLQRCCAPMAHAHALVVPLMIAMAQYENPYLDLYALQYAARVIAAGRTPRVIQVPQHNHTSIVAHLGCSDTGFITELLDFVSEHTALTPVC